jgi:hypothetical protein
LTNLARTLGADIVAAHFTGWWVYVIGDLIGAVIIRPDPRVPPQAGT